MMTDFNQLLAYNYGVLRRYMGAIQFSAMAAECTAAHAGCTHDSGYCCSNLPELLVQAVGGRPELGELAQLERAMKDALTTPDAAVMTRGQFENILVQHRNSISLKLHSSVSLLTFAYNTMGIWSSLRCDESAPHPYKLEILQRVMVWRQNDNARMRLLGEDEYLLAMLAQTDTNFYKLCKTLARQDECDDAEARALAYVRGWIDSEVLADTMCASRDKAGRHQDQVLVIQ